MPFRLNKEIDLVDNYFVSDGDPLVPAFAKDCETKGLSEEQFRSLATQMIDLLNNTYKEKGVDLEMADVADLGRRLYNLGLEQGLPREAAADLAETTARRFCEREEVKIPSNSKSLLGL